VTFIAGTKEAPRAVLAEDDEMLRALIAEELRHAGFHVSQADDGAQALAIIRAQPATDLLVSDIRMPGMNGFQLAETGLKFRPGMKVILMTGYAAEPVPASLRQHHLQIMQKPFDLEELSVLARRLIRTASST
jgi:hypothetical protein